MANNNNRNNKRRYKSKPRRDKSIEVKGNKEVLSMPIENLNLNENTFNLLKSNNFNTVYDIACNTERDMYRVQTFNKKNLLHLKSKLKNKGVGFLQPEEKTKNTNNVNANTNNDNNNNRNSNRNSNRNNNRRNNNGKNAQVNKNMNARGNNNRNRRPRKPRVELPLEEWRKVLRKGKWGYNNGLKTVIKAQFDEAFLFKEELACVELNEKFGYINSSGETIIPFEYDCAFSFSEGLAVVFKGEKCGYINKQNEVVIPLEYDAATAFENGRAKVKKDGKWSTIAPDGTELWSK